MTRTPAYRIVVDGEDVTRRWQGRLMRLQLRDLRGFEADQLDLTVSDHDNALELPRRGAKIELAIGYAEEETLVEKGIFIVDGITHSGPPDKMTVQANSADFRESFKTARSSSWDHSR